MMIEALLVIGRSPGEIEVTWMAGQTNGKLQDNHDDRSTHFTRCLGVSHLLLATKPVKKKSSLRGIGNS